MCVFLGSKQWRIYYFSAIGTHFLYAPSPIFIFMNYFSARQSKLLSSKKKKKNDALATARYIIET